MRKGVDNVEKIVYNVGTNEREVTKTTNIETIIERNEKTNQYGVKFVNELVRFDKAYSTGKIAKDYTKFVWYETVGENGIRSYRVSYKTEAKNSRGNG